MNGTFEAFEVRLATLERSRTRMRRAVVVLGVLVVMLAAPVVGTASHLFSDVPTGSTFHNDISAIAAAGITSGCGPATYCPESNVTRGQMAAFLRRGGGTITAELGTFPEGTDLLLPGVNSNQFLLVREIEVTVPGVLGGNAHQYVHVQGRAIVFGLNSGDMGCPCEFEAMIYVPESDYTSPSQRDTLLGGENNRAALDIDTVIGVTPGVRTFRLYVRVSERTSTTWALGYAFDVGTSLIATTYPFGSVVLE